MTEAERFAAYDRASKTTVDLEGAANMFTILTEQEMGVLRAAVRDTMRLAVWVHRRRASGLGFGWLWCIGDADGQIAEGATWTRCGATKATAEAMRRHWASKGVA